MESSTETPAVEARVEGDVKSLFYVDIDVHAKTRLTMSARSIGEDLVRLFGDELKKFDVTRRSSVFTSIEKTDCGFGHRDITVTFIVEGTLNENERFVTRLKSILSGLHAVYPGVLFESIASYPVDTHLPTVLEAMGYLTLTAPKAELTNDTQTD